MHDAYGRERRVLSAVISISQLCLIRHLFSHSSTGELSVALVWCLMCFSNCDCMLPGVKWMHSIWYDRHIFPCCLCLIFLGNLSPTPETSCQCNMSLTDWNCTRRGFFSHSLMLQMCPHSIFPTTLLFVKGSRWFSKAAVDTIQSVISSWLAKYSGLYLITPSVSATWGRKNEIQMLNISRWNGPKQADWIVLINIPSKKG